MSSDPGKYISYKSWIQRRKTQGWEGISSEEDAAQQPFEALAFKLPIPSTQSLELPIVTIFFAHQKEVVCGQSDCARCINETQYDRFTCRSSRDAATVLRYLQYDAINRTCAQSQIDWEDEDSPETRDRHVPISIVPNAGEELVISITTNFPFEIRGCGLWYYTRTMQYEPFDRGSLELLRCSVGGASAQTPWVVQRESMSVRPRIWKGRKEAVTEKKARKTGNYITPESRKDGTFGLSVRMRRDDILSGLGLEITAADPGQILPDHTREFGEQMPPTGRPLVLGMPPLLKLPGCYGPPEESTLATEKSSSNASNSEQEGSDDEAGPENFHTSAKAAISGNSSGSRKRSESTSRGHDGKRRRL